MFQVNRTTTVDGDVNYWISDYAEEGYVGELVDTQYSDGCDKTYWCIYAGTQEECEAYIAQHS